ncbi:hypothetical protein PLUTE_b0574 [Pseudoalteromonas luteoviolacea DSM 6061]|nr:hypothetical protein [Pseudoalteromonas luteoviolacea DSM 6061]
MSVTTYEGRMKGAVQTRPQINLPCNQRYVQTLQVNVVGLLCLQNHS